MKPSRRVSLLATVALCCALFGVGCDRNVKNLGGGFTVVHQPPADTSASKRHSDHHLYFGAKDLGTVAACFISPSTCYAIYDHEGKLILFHSCSETSKTIADLGAAFPMRITWSEARNEASIVLNGTNIIRVALSACACRPESRSLANNP